MIAAILALVLLRLEAEGNAGRDPSVLLTEIFIDDMDGTLRQIGIGDYVVGKHVGRMMSALGGRIAAFREAPAAPRGGRRNIFHEAPPSEALALVAAAARTVRRGSRRRRSSLCSPGTPAMTAPEFSRAVRIDSIGEQRAPLEIAADESERAALARRFGLLGLARLEAALTLSRRGEEITVHGTLAAAVTQACVATAAPVAAEVEAPFDILFRPQPEAAGAGGRGRAQRKRDGRRLP